MEENQPGASVNCDSVAGNVGDSKILSFRGGRGYCWQTIHLHTYLYISISSPFINSITCTKHIYICMYL